MRTLLLSLYSLFILISNGAQLVLFLEFFHILVHHQLLNLNLFARVTSAVQSEEKKNEDDVVVHNKKCAARQDSKKNKVEALSRKSRQQVTQNHSSHYR